MKRTPVPETEDVSLRADQLRPGDPYELSRGRIVRCFPTGGRGAKATGVGVRVLASDPAVRDVGVDTGFSPTPDTLRAPDLAVGPIPDQPGWVPGVPPLAVEYADTGQDEDQLVAKIRDLLTAGTRYLWVVRLTGPRRVEVHEPGKAMRIARPGDELLAPGVLANPIPVEALYDEATAEDLVFRNLLQRHGYGSLEAVRVEGEAHGEAQALRASIVEVLAARGLAAGDDLRSSLASCTDPDQLRALLRKAATAASPDEVVAALPYPGSPTEHAAG